MASEEPVRMLEGDTKDFELTELDGPEEELLGRYLPIGDVAKSIGVNPSVLRFWETVFPQLTPRRTDSGQRFYTEEDMALLRRIQQLLHQKGMTIEGARRILDGSATLDEVLPERAASKRDPALMLKLKNELTELRRVLAGR